MVDRPRTGMIVELNARSKEVFRQIVDAYVATGEPVGSRTIARRLDEQLSPATIRNVMADLEEAGLLYAPHTSAGRMPTDAGLRLYVDGLLEVGNVTDDEQREIEGQCAVQGRSIEGVLSDASTALSALSRYAGIVTAPVNERPFKHVEFVPLSPGRALVVVVGDNGMVENRVIDVPLGMSVSTLVEAGNYLTARLAGRSFAEARSQHPRGDRAAPHPARRADPEGRGRRARHLGRRSGPARRRVPDRARPRQAPGGRHQSRRPRAHPRPVRDAGGAREHPAAGRADPVGQEHADLHRRGEQAVRPLRLLDDRGPLHGGGRGRQAAPPCWGRSA